MKYNPPMRCSKCGATMYGPIYAETTDKLVYRCSCGWEKAVDPLDAKPPTVADLIARGAAKEPR